MELRHLRYFVAVAEELHFGRAAQRMFVVQPALSKQISALEKELGVVLLERDKRQVVLTSAGRVLLDDARRVLAQADGAAERARAAGRGAAGVLRIGFIAPVLYELLPDLLRAFRSRHPAVRLVLEEMHNREAIDAVLAGRVQAAFVRLPIGSSPELAVRAVRSEPLVLALPEGDPLAQTPEVDLADLAGTELIVIGRAQEPELHDFYVTLCAAHGFSPLIAHEVDRTHVAVGLVGCGLGVAFVPASAQQVAHPGVVYRQLRGPGHHLHVGVVWRSDPDPVLANFLTVCPPEDRPRYEAWTETPRLFD